MIQILRKNSAKISPAFRNKDGGGFAMTTFNCLFLQLHRLMLLAPVSISSYRTKGNVSYVNLRESKKWFYFGIIASVVFTSMKIYIFLLLANYFFILLSELGIYFFFYHVFHNSFIGLKNS